MSEPTTPWRYRREVTRNPGAANPERVSFEIYNERGSFANPATCDTEANAAFIVTAVNAHDDLVAALKAATHELNQIRARCGVPYWPHGRRSDVDEIYFSSVVDAGFAALARAGEAR